MSTTDALLDVIALKAARIAELEAEVAELAGAGRCSAFCAWHPTQCIRANDHEGEHVFEEDLQNHKNTLAELARLREAIRKEVASGSPWEGLVYADRIRAALAREEE